MHLNANLFYELLLLLIHVNSPKTVTLAQELFILYEEQAENIENIQYCTLYVNIIKDVMSHKYTLNDNKVDINNSIVRHLSNKIFRGDKYIRKTLKGVMKAKVDQVRLAEIIERLNNIVLWWKSRAYIGKMYGNLNECKLSYQTSDQTEKLNTIKELITDFKSTLLDIDSIVGKSGAVERIDFSKKEDIDLAFDTYMERQVTHVLKTGLQGLNDMLGPKRQGVALGESILFCSLLHNYKSGQLMNCARWIADYSVPPKVPNKKPLILFISLENIGYMNMMEMFVYMYKVLNDGKDPTEAMSNDDIKAAIFEYFNKSPYTLVIERYLPSTFGYDELVALVERYENAGYNVVATIIDYLSQMKKDGNASRIGGHVLVKELYNKVCNYFKAIGTTLITAAQLNRDAANIVGTGVNHPVKQFSERHIAESIDIGREVDFICYMHIENDDENNRWLTMQWGKHRYVNDTPEKHKFVAYKFNRELGIPDDYGGKFSGVRNIHRKAKESAETPDIESILGITSPKEQ